MTYKKKLIISVSILLICVLLLAAVSYAWLTMSIAPEIVGVETHIGANGSLEIALVTDSTYLDPSTVKTAVGSSSSVLDPTQSNLYWGSVIDLSSSSYGLNNISLRPSRLNVFSNDTGTPTIGSNILLIPDYSTDGRMEIIHSNTVSATYKDTDFVYSTDAQSYGVRAIGTIPNLSLQESSLANARSAVRAYTSSSNSSVTSLWKANGAHLISLYINHYKNSNDSFTDTDVAMLKDTVTRLQSTLSYIDLALRQGIVGYAASVMDNNETFKTVKSTVENTSFPLSAILSSSPIGVPSEISGWVTLIDNYRQQLALAEKYCSYLKGGNYTWEQIYPLLTCIMDDNYVYLENTPISSINSSTKLSQENLLTISTKAGVMASVADFSGNFKALFDYADSTHFEAGSVSAVSPPYLVTLAGMLDEYTAATNSEGFVSSPLSEIYGYAVDMVFRCNTNTDLLLQTDATPTSNITDNAGASSGSGSFMSFGKTDLTSDQLVRLMDAIRIGFTDNQGNLLGIAKLNVSNYEQTDGSISAPIYLYDYSVNSDGSITMGERLDDKSPIVSLQKNLPTIITAIIWLDGDCTDNSAAFINQESLSGSLNLQFSSSAELIPAQ